MAAARGRAARVPQGLALTALLFLPPNFAFDFQARRRPSPRESGGFWSWFGGLAAVLAIATAAPAAQAFPSVQSPDGGVVVHKHFIEVHAGSIPPNVVGLARLDKQDELQSDFGRNGLTVERAAPGADRETAHLAMDEAGRISVAVTPTGSRGARIRRYLANGARDWSLGGDGEVQVGVPAAQFEATDLFALSGGVLLLGGG